MLKAGRVLTVKTSTSESQPADSETSLAPLHPALAEELRGAAQAVGLRLAGIAVVTPSLDEPLRESGGAIIEVTRTQVCGTTTRCRTDRAMLVARLILRHLFDQDRN